MAHESDPLRTVKVPLEWLAELDECPCVNGLQEALGDRYLCRYNPIFKNVRDAVVAFGYSFSCSDTPLWRDYHSFALLTLHEILSGKVIPYFDNATTFCRLLRRDRTTSLPLRFIHNNMTKNHIFHESGHCVAHHLVEQVKPDVSVTARSEKEHFVLRALLEESFANTIEMLGNAFVKSIPDSLFYGLNSFTIVKNETKEILRRCSDTLGEEVMFAVLYLGYLEANLSAGGPSEKTYARVAEIAGCPTTAMERAKELTDLALSLSLSFRRDTTPVYFRLLGYGDEYTAVTEAPWLEDDVHAIAVRQLLLPFQHVALQGPNTITASVALAG